VRAALPDYGPPSPTAEAAIDARFLPNLWLGVSVESQKWTFRLDKLAATTAGARQRAAGPALAEAGLTPV
jgi:protein gp37